MTITVTVSSFFEQRNSNRKELSELCFNSFWQLLQLHELMFLNLTCNDVKMNCNRNKPTQISERKKTAQRKSFWAGYSWNIRDPDVRISLTLALGCPRQKLHARCLLAGNWRPFPQASPPSSPHTSGSGCNAPGGGGLGWRGGGGERGGMGSVLRAAPEGQPHIWGYTEIGERKRVSVAKNHPKPSQGLAE